MTSYASAFVRPQRDHLLERARAYADRGAALGGSGRSDEAEIALRIAVQLARCGNAPALADQALLELRRTS